MDIGFLVEQHHKPHPPSASPESVKKTLLRDGFVVVRDHARFLGILTSADLLRLPGTSVGEFLCSLPPVREDDDILDALQRMQQAGVCVLPVFRGDLFVGVVRLQKIAACLLTQFGRGGNSPPRDNGMAGDRQAALFHTSRLSMLGEMVSGLAHQLNQPLSAILSYGDASLRLLQAGPPDVPRIAKNLGEILRQGERAGILIRRMRALAKGRSSQFAPANLNEIVRNAVTLTQWDLTQNGVVLNLELAEPLPPVHADEVQIEQVLLNLIRNAIDAMREVTGRRRLLTLRTAAQGGDRVLVEVSDTGVGLPPEGAALLFEPFFSTKPDGLGIGLSIGRSIIEAHKGTLAARSNPDWGATFFFTLPVEQPVGS